MKLFLDRKYVDKLIITPKLLQQEGPSLCLFTVGKSVPV